MKKISFSINFFDLLFRHYFFPVDKARRRADTLYITPATVRSIESRQRSEATVHGIHTPETMRREHVVHQREAQER